MIFAIACCYGVASLSARCRNGHKKMRRTLNAKIVVFGARGLRKYYAVRDFKDKNEMLPVNLASFPVHDAF